MKKHRDNCGKWDDKCFVTNGAIIAGIDEAGRGAIAGPVVAGACILPIHLPIPPFIVDSKILSPMKREEAFAWITTHCRWGRGIVEAEVIDREGILPANEKAMQEAVRHLSETLQPTYLLIDGRDKFWFDIPHSSLIHGDALEPCISAASIIAKVTRDRLMIDHHHTFPAYGFDRHKGYGAESHFEAIRRSGPCVLHRRTFLHGAKE